MKYLFTVSIPSLNGKKLIKDSKLFKWIDSDFVSYGADEPGYKTEKGQLDVLELDKNGTFKDIFTEPDKMCLSQEQILWFVKNHRDKLRTDGSFTFFLFKSKDNFFVAYVSFRSAASLYVDVYRFERSSVWSAGRRLRVVVPQLDDSLFLKTFAPLKYDAQKDYKKATKEIIKHFSFKEYKRFFESDMHWSQRDYMLVFNGIRIGQGLQWQLMSEELKKQIPINEKDYKFYDDLPKTCNGQGGNQND